MTMFECPRCKARVEEEWVNKMERVVCPECGYKILRKIRPPFIKRVKAR